MMSSPIPTSKEIRTAYQQGELAVMGLVERLCFEIRKLQSRVQELEIQVSGTSTMQVSGYGGFDFDALSKTPEHIWDVGKLLAAAVFPVYALLNERLDFLLRHINVGAHGSEDDERLSQIALGYVSPGYAEHTQALTIASCLSGEFGQPVSEYIKTVVANMHGFRPEGATGLSTLGGLWKSPPWTEEDFVQVEESYSQIVWQPYTASGLQFSLFHQEEPGPVSLAYHEEEKGNVIVASIGTPRPKFLTVLESLVELHGAASLVDKLQNDLKIAHQEMGRIMREQRR